MINTIAGLLSVARGDLGAAIAIYGLSHDEIIDTLTKERDESRRVARELAVKLVTSDGDELNDVDIDMAFPFANDARDIRTALAYPDTDTTKEEQ